ELVDWILQTVGVTQQKPTNILDIGTGSGCIAISLKKHLNTNNVSALDVSADALIVAEKNAVLNNVIINFINQDILTYSGDENYDLIVSNPPYIKEDERADMHQNVLDHEPHLALFVATERPLLFYEAIADFAIKHLRQDGNLFFEINEYLGKETVAMLEDKGFNKIILKKDMQGKDRMICCSL
ncbi:MAG: peptide chain release factor N(5)-glutamine methyltransferase, partial [Pedobacter sp.]|nr:peptide chain release factor N(5)-glutamine methyltransferase [Pedobacter sp.]